jgi:hypothetical protein
MDRATYWLVLNCTNGQLAPPVTLHATAKALNIEQIPAPGRQALSRLLYHSARQEHGLKRLRTSLTASGSPEFIQARILPFLQLLGSDELCRGTCKASQAQVLHH